MLTSSEKRFIKSWEEQRKGGRIRYYLLYILSGTFVGTIVISFLTVLSGGFTAVPWGIILGSFSIVTVATVFAWQYNERKFKAIIQREVREGKLRDSEQS